MKDPLEYLLVVVSSAVVKINGRNSFKTDNNFFVFLPIYEFPQVPFPFFLFKIFLYGA